MSTAEKGRTPGVPPALAHRRWARRVTTTALGAAAASAVLIGTAPGIAPASAGAPPCRSNQLAASVTDGGSMASQPWAVIGLHNTSGSACVLDGYASVVVSGQAVTNPAGDGALAISVTDGSLYGRPDPGPSAVNVGAGQWANFSIGTGAGYHDQYRVFRILIVRPDGGSVPLDLHMFASAPAGQAVPVGITAFAAGAA
jgi:hypothetical protein